MNRLCSEPRCGSYATERGRCATHARKQRHTIERQGRKVYNSKRWQMLRRKKLLLNAKHNGGWCETCDTRPANEVHHLEGVALDPYSLKGLQALCKPCHSAQTQQEMAAR